MHDALAHLPADGYAIKHEAIELAQEAQTAELFGIMHLARQLAEITNIRAKELDTDKMRDQISSQLTTLSKLVADVVF